MSQGSPRSRAAAVASRAGVEVDEGRRRRLVLRLLTRQRLRHPYRPRVPRRPIGQDHHDLHPRPRPRRLRSREPREHLLSRFSDPERSEIRPTHAPRLAPRSSAPMHEPDPVRAEPPLLTWLRGVIEASSSRNLRTGTAIRTPEGSRLTPSSLGGSLLKPARKKGDRPRPDRYTRLHTSQGYPSRPVR